MTQYAERDVVMRARELSPLTARGDVTTITSLPQTVNLEVYRGDDFVLTLHVTDADGQAADLDGATAESQIRQETEAQTVTATFAPEIHGNDVVLWLTHEQATRLIPGNAVWDCQIIDADQRVTTLCAGSIATTADVTR